MSEHVIHYLDCEQLRRRAERAERLSTMWRLTGWVFGLVVICLLAVVVRQESDLEIARNADLPTMLCSQQAADIDDVRIAAEQNFKRCLAANAGLVDSLREFDRTIKDQQQLINESIALAKRCEAEPTSWVVVPTASQVLPP